MPTTTTNPRLGTYLTTSTAGENVRAFVPPALPPDPPLDISPELHDLLEKANRGLGRLDGVARLFPDPDLFLYMYVRKEALLSSQIEGTQSSFSDLLLFENKEVPGVPMDDVKEVSNYVAAMNHGLERLRGGFPLSLRLLKEIHGILLSKGRGHAKAPGEFRTSQNWIGGSRPGNAAFVPPPPNKVMECMGALEKFLHDEPVKTPLLVKAALAHVQFETIHPFLDGNGRAGRLLITLLMCAEGALAQRGRMGGVAPFFSVGHHRHYRASDAHGAAHPGIIPRRSRSRRKTGTGRVLDAALAPRFSGASHIFHSSCGEACGLVAAYCDRGHESSPETRDRE